MNAHDSMTQYVAARAPHLAPRHRAADVPAVDTDEREPRGYSLRTLLVVAVVGALLGLWLSPGRAYADPSTYIPGGARDVVRVDPAPAGPRITVTLSNGAVDVLRPCVFEDGRHCYWIADDRGNGHGDSFIVTRGRVHYLNLRGFDPLA